MAEFSLIAQKLKSEANEISGLAGSVGGYSSRVSQVCAGLTLEGSAGAAVKRNLRQLSSQIEKQGNKLKKASTALTQAVSLYEAAEKQIAGAGKDSLGDAIQDQAADYDRTTTTFDDDEDNGTYGADQGNMAHNKKGIWFFGFRWFEDEELYARVRSYDRYKDYSQTEIAELLDQINEEGCGYIAVVNNIFVEYEGREKEFEETFGFPMYDEDGEANYDYLILDIYAETDDKYYINEPKGATALVNDVILDYTKNGREAEFREKYGCDPLDDGTWINDEARQKILDEYAGQDVVEYSEKGTTSYSIENRMSHYLNEKNVSYSCESEGSLSTDQVDAYIDEGKNVNIATGEFNLYDKNGNAVKTDVGSHWMTITGVTEDGRYIVSSWGERYYINPSELSGANFFITDIAS